ncbi:MAG TPA: DUF1178 family protein [Kiloniellales bacterium]
MILYSLRCHKDHIFETWFRDSAAYDSQSKAAVIECPVCGSKRVEKAIMAPNVAKSAGRSRSRDDVTAATGAPGSAAAPSQVPVSGATTKAMREVEQSAKVRRALQELRRQVEENFDYVGPEFAEEARKIHYGETDERPIYGETSEEEARALEEEGVSVRRIPWLPREDS